MARCPWAKNGPYEIYHDLEWGVPSHDDHHLFEMLILEGAQAGLSWETILKKRDGYRRAFDDFEPETIASYDQDRIESLLTDTGIVRNRAKVQATVLNARSFLQIRDEFGSFDKYIWQFVGGKPIQNAWTSLGEVPAQTPQAQAMSKDLLRRGFKFVGPTICYAYMQAVGMVNDHLVTCPQWKALGGKRGAS